MTTQVPPGPENTVAPHDYPQFVTGHAQYPPPPPPGEYPTVSYPQEGAAGYPVPVPYPQPGTPQPAAYPAAAPQPAAHPATAPQPPAGPAAAPHAADYPVAVPQPDAHPAAPAHAGYPAEQQTAGYPTPPPTAYPQTQPTAGYPLPPQSATTPGAERNGGYPGGPQAATQPVTAYPTAPPWASPAVPALPAGGSDQPFPQHGGLLVPFPDEMAHASRAKAPAVWPVAVFTLLFSILGAVSAKRRADQARRTRNSSAPYWIAFLVSAAAGAFVWFVLGAVVVAPLVTEAREAQRLEAVQRNVVGDGQLKDARIEATAARCRAVTDRDPDGMRDYLCRLTLADGHTASLTLTADESGQWHSGSGR